MHQIQKLEIVGFKSFCDRTQIIFNEGVTAIVGPNGCGKSNIADAISWVVGEQSAKSLRTDRMEGVIFNGTQARKATGMAEVILTLSLMEHFSVPDGMDLQPEGFTVGRRLYRSGESEYFLDGRRCRLKDIQALFEGTGLGPNSYALIEQGRIGQILSSKPADRRALIEEAARITLFKSRRYSAEMKLEMAQQNLVRVHDIIREVARQLNSLRRQAAKARRYSRLRDELRGLQKLKLALEHRQLSGRLQECEARFSAALEHETAVLEELSHIEQERAAEQDACRGQEETANAVRDKLATLKLEIGRAQNLSQNQEVQRHGLAARIADLDLDCQAIEERGQVVQREQERVRTTLAQLAEEIAQEQATLDGEQSRAEVLQEAMRQAEAQIEEVRSFLLNGAGHLADLKNQQSRCQENIERIAIRTGRLEGEIAETARGRTILLAELNRAREQADTQASRQSEVLEQQLQLERRSEAMVERLESTAAELAAQQEEHSLLQHRFSSLEEVERRRSNYSEGVQKYLSAQLPGEEAARSETLADHVETDPRFETAIEDYLNDPLQYILVDRLNDAVQSVERVKRIGAGKCTFLTIQNGRAHAPAPPRRNVSGDDGIVGYLDGLLRMREDVRHAFERALPDFASTLMVTDLNTAFRVAEGNPDSSYLTLSGESYSPRGTLSAVGERKSMAGFLALKREKRELEVKLAGLRVKIQAARDEVSRLKQEQTATADSLKMFSGEARRLEMESVRFQNQIERLTADMEKLGQAETVATGELMQLLGEKEGYQGRLQDATEHAAEIEDRSRTSGEELRQWTVRLDSIRVESAALSKTLAGMISAHAVKQERRSAMEGELERLLGEADEVGRRIQSNRTDRGAALERIAELESARKETGIRIEELKTAISEAETALAQSQHDLAARREALAGLEERARLLHARREEALAVRGKIEIEKARLENDLEHLTRGSHEEFHIPPEQLASEIDEASWQRDLEEVVRQHDDLRERVENFGAINMRALEEYQELDERYQFLTKQRLDIEQSIADTQKAISEINRRSVEQFEDAFKHIRENFIEVFQILFTGGQCDLRLLDDDDKLESGIDIIAQPPGKRLQNVLLLSGGEKALTALALLIAIFRYRPSPFCVLDEVDAPLDDANITRFTQLLTELSKETQFVVVTHNKRTMEVARTLYGVTMEEPGVSKIVGVDFRKEEKKAS
jgi:chromosome segregation protein